MLMAHKDRYSAQFFAGVAFSGAFISALFPLPGLTLVPYIPFLIFFVLCKPDLGGLRFTTAVLLLGFVSLYYIFWLAVEPGGHSRSLIVRLVYFYALAFAFVFGRVVYDPQEFMRGFWKLLLPLSVISACLGIVKVAFQSRGYIIGPLDFFYTMAGAGYPYGSSLIVDYNIYSSSLMVAMIGFILRINRSVGGIDWWGIIAVVIILSSLYMCGSRRSYALLAVLYMILSFFVILRKNKKIACWFFAATLLMFLSIYVFSGVLISSEVVGRYKVIFPMGPIFDSIMGGIFGYSPQDLGSSFDGGVLTYRPQDLVSSMSSDQSFGLWSRLIRWEFALDLLARGDWLFGGGFSYQDEYSCRFSGCRIIDYPHNVFLSEWLVSGLLGVLAMLFLFCMILGEMVRRRKKVATSGVLLILFAVLPGALISGDGVFSVPQILVSIMMAFIYSYEEDGALLRFSERGDN